jgi:hypothetical protein
VWWCAPVIPTLRRQRQEEDGKFQASLDNIVRLCLKKSRERQRQRETEREKPLWKWNFWNLMITANSAIKGMKKYLQGLLTAYRIKSRLLATKAIYNLVSTYVIRLISKASYTLYFSHIVLVSAILFLLSQITSSLFSVRYNRIDCSESSKQNSLGSP